MLGSRVSISCLPIYLLLYGFLPYYRVTSSAACFISYLGATQFGDPWLTTVLLGGNVVYSPLPFYLFREVAHLIPQCPEGTYSWPPADVPFPSTPRRSCWDLSMSQTCEDREPAFSYRLLPSGVWLDPSSPSHWLKSPEHFTSLLLSSQWQTI